MRIQFLLQIFQLIHCLYTYFMHVLKHIQMIFLHLINLFYHFFFIILFFCFHKMFQYIRWIRQYLTPQWYSRIIILIVILVVISWIAVTIRIIRVRIRIISRSMDSVFICYVFNIVLLIHFLLLFNSLLFFWIFFHSLMFH